MNKGRERILWLSSEVYGPLLLILFFLMHSINTQKYVKSNYIGIPIKIFNKFCDIVIYVLH